jgi:hypothetical protein
MNIFLNLVIFFDHLDFFSPVNTILNHVNFFLRMYNFYKTVKNRWKETRVKQKNRKGSNRTQKKWGAPPNGPVHMQASVALHRRRYERHIELPRKPSQVGGAISRSLRERIAPPWERFFNGPLTRAQYRYTLSFSFFVFSYLLSLHIFQIRNIFFK